MQGILQYGDELGAVELAGIFQGCFRVFILLQGIAADGEEVTEFFPALFRVFDNLGQERGIVPGIPVYPGSACQQLVE